MTINLPTQSFADHIAELFGAIPHVVAPEGAMTIGELHTKLGEVIASNPGAKDVLVWTLDADESEQSGVHIPDYVTRLDFDGYKSDTDEPFIMLLTTPAQPA